MAAKILVIDDDPLTRRLFHAALTGDGFKVALAADAMTALAEAQKQRPDLILLDLGLPGGGGFVFMERLRHFPNLEVVPIIVVSGQDSATNAPRALEAGAAAYIEKPARPADLVTTVRQVLGRS